ncbi:tripartite tricarboxylate transporter TctB family protein [Larsenimonas suaedae]|uniref:Tripartite tricarboxylate transporter TctB family protein n=1 Tax=Larsenimonas suaedae TaxID=1851019 RepID=A0ABU1GUB5_9GAMM|nr:tripartite tricarboxylate transporter TctB family protein [Larsenimonas suaedae]MCM2972216.1 tripartite tricarboxylate transporter TctB family protein [Larsenimonas suaedae]MDR5894988.1 tripartite tricarboxylate transporter TctB family protein [Larsenimonas suaedae]
MESGTTSPLSVSIDFQTSHLFFPHIINWTIGLLFVLVLVFRVVPFLKKVKRGESALPFIGESMDGFRFVGTLVLLVAYFYLMSVVGDYFPYTGYGFLFTSIGFLFLMSLLYMHTRTKRKIIVAGINALLAPALAWVVFAKLFYITLP